MAAFLQSRFFIGANIVLLFFLLCFSINRDIQFEKQYTSDLRNRVVGARLQKDGKAPYFYKWKKEDGLRYFDRENKNTTIVSNITASPVFHDLLIPVCELPQRSISIIWFCMQYFILALITFLFIRISTNNLQKTAILNVAVLFTYTDAWQANISAGQAYFLLAMLFALVIYFLYKSTENKRYQIPAGLCAALLILCKPTAIILFLPFCIRLKKHFKFLLYTSSIVLLYSVFVLFNKNEARFWIAYKQSLTEHVKLHQHLTPLLVNAEALPEIKELEGYHLGKATGLKHTAIHSENGNVFILINAVMHKKISVAYLTGLFCIVVIFLMAAFIRKNMYAEINLQETVLLAFLLYLLTEFFSPVYRHQYYTVQFLPLLFTSMLNLKKLTEPVSILIAAGLVLNITNIAAIPMQHTLGEFCWMLAFALIIFSKNQLKHTT
jgi:hypothetical protein